MTRSKNQKQNMSTNMFQSEARKWFDVMIGASNNVMRGLCNNTKTALCTIRQQFSVTIGAAGAIYFVWVPDFVGGNNLLVDTTVSAGSNFPDGYSGTTPFNQQLPGPFAATNPSEGSRLVSANLEIDSTGAQLTQSGYFNAGQFSHYPSELETSFPVSYVQNADILTRGDARSNYKLCWVAANEQMYDFNEFAIGDTADPNSFIDIYGGSLDPCTYVGYIVGSAGSSYVFNLEYKIEYLPHQNIQAFLSLDFPTVNAASLGFITRLVHDNQSKILGVCRNRNAGTTTGGGSAGGGGAGLFFGKPNVKKTSKNKTHSKKPQAKTEYKEDREEEKYEIVKKIVDVPNSWEDGPTQRVIEVKKVKKPDPRHGIQVSHDEMARMNRDKELIMQQRERDKHPNLYVQTHGKGGHKKDSAFIRDVVEVAEIIGSD
jgi:hypothetical protein